MFRCCYFFLRAFQHALSAKKSSNEKPPLYQSWARYSFIDGVYIFPYLDSIVSISSPAIFSAGANPAAMHRGPRLRLLRGAGVLYCPLLSLFDAVVITQGPTPPDDGKSDKVVLSANSVRIAHSSLGENRHAKEMGCIVRALSVNPAPHHHLPWRFEYFGFQF